MMKYLKFLRKTFTIEKTKKYLQRTIVKSLQVIFQFLKGAQQKMKRLALLLKDPRVVISVTRSKLSMTTRFLKKLPKLTLEYFFIFLMSAENNVRRFERRKIKDIPTILEIREYQKYIRKKSAKIVFISVMALMLVVSFPGLYRKYFAQSASYSWIQTNWTTLDAVTAVASNAWNNTWTKYVSKNAPVDANGASGIALHSHPASQVVENSSGTYTGSSSGGGTYVSGAVLSLKKPVGANCGGDNECTTNTCQTTCVIPCSAITPGQTCTFNSITYGVVTANGKLWLDRNLGARQVATAYNDQNAYGWLFQWGRAADGHQYTAWGGQPSPALSSTTSTQSATDTPGHANFITNSSDWRNPQNNNLWGSGSGYINNPCPSGFHVPTQTEWASVVSALGITNYTTAYNSVLKLPAAGYRYVDGGLSLQGSFGGYWSSTPFTTSAYLLSCASSSVDSSGAFTRAYGISVRCIHN